MTSTSTYLGYRIYAADYNKTLQQTAAGPVVSRDTAYYNSNINKVKSVDDFVDNYQLFSYAMNAAGLSDMTYAKAFMKKVLTSDPSDSSSLVNTLTDPRYKAFAQQFSFITAKGSTLGNVANTATAQSSDQENDTLGLYEKNAASISASDETYYKANIGSVKTVGDLTGNARLYQMVLTAYGLDNAQTDATTLKQGVTEAVESDASDPNSEVRQGGNATLKALAADFNFAADGTVTTQRLAQGQADFTAMQTAYSAQAGTDTASKTAATAESTYVGNVIGRATSIGDIVNDPRVVSYIGKAFGVSNLDAKTLNQVLTSDPSDLTSQANTLGNNYREIAQAFNFTTTGTIARAPAQAVQSKAQLAETTRASLEQTLDTNASDAQGEGVRLALNFRQKAASITNVYQILANTDLLTVVQTALGIPASSSSQDIDVQANVITSRLKLTTLQDPTKLDKFISQFAALYDINNATSSTSTSSSSMSLLSLFTSDGSSSVSVLSLFASDSSSTNYNTLSLFQ